MIDTVFNLIAILMWAGSVFCFIAGGFVCIVNLINGNGDEQFKSIIALVLGIGAFVLVYRWMDSLLWSMLAAGSLFLWATQGETSGRTSTGGGIIDILGNWASEEIERDREAKRNAKATADEWDRRGWH